MMTLIYLVPIHFLSLLNKMITTLGRVKSYHRVPRFSQAFWEDLHLSPKIPNISIIINNKNELVSWSIGSIFSMNVYI